MKLSKQIRYSIRWDINWLREDRLPYRERIAYIFRKYYSFATKSKEIRYLGNRFRSDNITTPVSLQSYPNEIFGLNDYIDLRQTCTVLDVGANAGQFSVSLATLFPDSRIYSFEANPDIYELLKSNTQPLPNITTFNSALGPNGKMTFYYVPGKSAKGSFIKSNSIINLNIKNPKEIIIDSIELTNISCAKLGIPRTYDLVKIDVEGFEYQVLEAIKEIRTKYLFMEFSIGRESGYEFIDLLNKIESAHGRIKILFCDAISKERSMGNMLVECIDYSVDSSS